jgi:hypothetical protein
MILTVRLADFLRTGRYQLEELRSAELVVIQSTFPHFASSFLKQVYLHVLRGIEACVIHDQETFPARLFSLLLLG